MHLGRHSFAGALLAFIFVLTLPMAVSEVERRYWPADGVAGAGGFFDVNYDNINKNIMAISSFGSRLTGYVGSAKAADYIEGELRSYGLRVVRQPFRVIVPVDEGSSISVLDSSETKYVAYAIWPNGIQTSTTPPEGLIGPLVYVGRGSLSELEGKNLQGAIALMDYESGSNWLNVAKLGAKGAIFIAPPQPSTYSEALGKFVDTPLYFPRVYVAYEQGVSLKRIAPSLPLVRLESKMRLCEVTAENIIGILEGSRADETIIVSSYYDSWAPAPLLASSAKEAISPAYVLELANVMSKSKPLRTVWFVFFSGHWQALQGSREFVERYYFGPEAVNGTLKPMMLINVGNLDPEGTGLELIRGGAGTLYATVGIASGITQRYGWVRQQIFTRYLHDPTLIASVRDMTGSEPSDLVREFFTNDMFWGTGTYYYMLDSEPAELTRGLSFTIQTSFASKQWIGDLSEARALSPEEVARLAPQLVITGHLIGSFVNEPDWGALWAETSPLRVYIIPGGFSQYSGFITLKGETLVYNLTKGWYSPLPHALVRVSVGMVIGGTNYFPYPYPFNKYMVYSDENGRFEVHGLSPYPFIPGRYIIDAWVVNETSGKIVYAPDMGVYGAKVLPPIASPLAHPDKASVVLMKVGGAITMYDVFDPRTGIPGLIPDLRAPSFGSNGGWFYNKGALLMPQDFPSKGESLFYGVYYNGYEPLALVFGLSGSKMMVMAKSGGVSRAVELKPFLVLVNNSQADPEGYGITLSGESPSVYDGNALIYAEQIVLLTGSRYDKLSSRGVRSVSIEEKLTKAEQYLKEAKVLYEARKYSEAYSKALVAWAWGSRTYEEVMVLIDDSGRTSLFYFALIIPAAILMERLLVHAEGKRQLLSIIALGGLMLAFFALVHPALTVMTNSTMAILGLIAFTLFIATAGILADATQKILKEISYKVLGVHTIETERVGIVATAFTVSIENMRRRWFRTLLVFMNLVSISFALTSLTSISPYVGIKYVPWGENLVAPYSGILVKSSFSVPPGDVLGPYTAHLVQGIVGEGAMMLPRSWCYPSSVGPNVGVVTNLVSKKSTGEIKTYQINAMLGLTPKDVSYTLENYSITPLIYGGEKYFCIIPDTAAKALDVTLGDRVTVQGISFRVSGIYNATLMTPEAMRDLSGVGISPTDPYYVQALGIGVTVPLVAGQQPPQLSWSRLIVIPYDVAIELGGYVAEVSIRFTRDANAEEVRKLSADLASILNVPVYIGIEGRVKVSSRVSTFSAFGLEGVIMLLAIGSLNVIATLIGIQRERVKDMYTYTTVGLTPTGAITMVMLESTVYSLLGILIGYFLGFIGNDLFRSVGILPTNFTFNYASLFAMASLLITLLSALVASVYPAYSAAKLVTVSLERKWKPPTKPKRGHWEIPLPMKIAEVDEVGGLLTFLREYYLGAGTEKPSFKVNNVHALSAGVSELRLRVELSLAPYEAGVNGTVDINALRDEQDKSWNFMIVLGKVTGEEDIWEKGSYAFVDDLRRQMLLWRFLSVDDRTKYITIYKSYQSNQKVE